MGYQRMHGQEKGKLMNEKVKKNEIPHQHHGDTPIVLGEQEH